MAETNKKRSYRPTESEYKGMAKDMYVTYDLEQKTRSGGTAMYPKVKRVYVAGDVKDWQVGTFNKRSGRAAFGVRIEYEQSRKGYQRGETTYQVEPATVKPTTQKFSKIVEVPDNAQNIEFHEGELPKKYQGALQDVR